MYNSEQDYLQIAYMDPQLNQMGQEAQQNQQQQQQQISPMDPSALPSSSSNTNTNTNNTVAPLSIQVGQSNGPFLTPSQPVSPFGGSWTSENSPFRSNSNTYTSNVNTPGSEGSPRNPSFSDNQNQQIPRYVSSSAFPDTPLSSGSGGNGINGWPGQNERIISFSTLTAQTSDTHSTDLDNIWEEEEKNTEHIHHVIQPQHTVLRQSSMVIKQIDPTQNQNQIQGQNTQQLSVNTGTPEQSISTHNTPSVIASPPTSAFPQQSEYEASISGNSSSDSLS